MTSATSAAAADLALGDGPRSCHMHSMRLRTTHIVLSKSENFSFESLRYANSLKSHLTNQSAAALLRESFTPPSQNSRDHQQQHSN